MSLNHYHKHLTIKSGYLQAPLIPSLTAYNVLILIHNAFTPHSTFTWSRIVRLYISFIFGAGSKAWVPVLGTYHHMVWEQPCIWGLPTMEDSCAEELVELKDTTTKICNYGHKILLDITSVSSRHTCFYSAANKDANKMSFPCSRLCRL